MAKDAISELAEIFKVSLKPLSSSNKALVMLSATRDNMWELTGEVQIVMEHDALSTDKASIQKESLTPLVVQVEDLDTLIQKIQNHPEHDYKSEAKKIYKMSTSLGKEMGG